jgi:hypothetical protein
MLSPENHFIFCDFRPTAGTCQFEEPESTFG